jgi:hypothetical protein
MIHPMNFHMPTDEEIHTAFEQGEAAVMAVFHAVATQVAALAQQFTTRHFPSTETYRLTR